MHLTAKFGELPCIDIVRSFNIYCVKKAKFTDGKTDGRTDERTDAGDDKNPKTVCCILNNWQHGDTALRNT